MISSFFKFHINQITFLTGAGTKQETRGHYPLERMSLKYCTIRSAPRKFGISFAVPDRVTAEITDKKRVMGRHPMRISRIPSGGPLEFHNLVEEAEKESSPLALQKKNGGVWRKKKKLDHKKAYHRSRFNEWYVEVFYFDDWSESQTSDPDN